MEFIFAGFGLVIGFILGFIVSSIFKLELKVSKKEDFEQKTKQLDELITKLQQEETTSKYTGDDFFPPDIGRDYGLPKDIK
jgi:uncharacterized membrane-anchored protein YhcB (DUF1043 family)